MRVWRALKSYWLDAILVMVLIFMVGFAGTIAAYRWVIHPAKARNAQGVENMHPLYGKQAPEIHGTTRDGKPFDLTFPTDRPVLLIFWASWCPYCQREVPAVMRLLSGARDIASPTRQNVRVIGILFKDEPSVAVRFLEEQSTVLETVRDPDDVLSRQFKVASVPTYLLLDETGLVIYTRQGSGLTASNGFLRILEGVRASPGGSRSAKTYNERR
jgi:cytochrome c biogenesis protein CcmG/thiol:disulfide interchange protein DsbE